MSTTAARRETFECGRCKAQFSRQEEYERHLVRAHNALAQQRREHEGCMRDRECHCLFRRFDLVASELREEEALLHALFRRAGRDASRREAGIPAPAGTFQHEIGSRLVSDGLAFWLNGEVWLSEPGFRRAGMRWG